MTQDVTRRKFLNAAGTAAALGAIAATASAEEPAQSKKLKIIAISGSLRKGKTTAAGLTICLEAAKAVAPDEIEIELIELADYKINDALAVDKNAEPDDFDKLAPKLTDPRVGGIILGSPSYFGNMSGQLKSFLDRCSGFRKNFVLSNKVGGALSVASGRNGGQEQILRSIHTSLFSQEMILVGDGRPTAHWGATLWNQKDDISQDEFGVSTAKNLGRRVAEVARLIHR